MAAHEPTGAEDPEPRTEEFTSPENFRAILILLYTDSPAPEWSARHRTRRHTQHRPETAQQ